MVLWSGVEWREKGEREREVEWRGRESGGVEREWRGREKEV